MNSIVITKSSILSDNMSWVNRHDIVYTSTDHNVCLTSADITKLCYTWLAINGEYPNMFTSVGFYLLWPVLSKWCIVQASALKWCTASTALCIRDIAPWPWRESTTKYCTVYTWHCALTLTQVYHKILHCVYVTLHPDMSLPQSTALCIRDIAP